MAEDLKSDHQHCGIPSATKTPEEKYKERCLIGKSKTWIDRVRPDRNSSCQDSAKARCM